MMVGEQQKNTNFVKKMSVQVSEDLIKSGFVAGNEKSVWKPVQSIDWLGFIWNLSSGTLAISQKKFETLKSISGRKFAINV